MARRPPGHEVLAVYERLQRRLGRMRAPPETPSEYRAAVAAGAAGDLGDLLDEATDAVNQGAYAGRWPAPDAVDRLRRRLGRRRRPR